MGATGRDVSVAEESHINPKSCRDLQADCSDAFVAPFGPGSLWPVCVCIPKKKGHRRRGPSEECSAMAR